MLWPKNLLLVSVTPRQTLLGWKNAAEASAPPAVRTLQRHQLPQRQGGLAVGDGLLGLVASDSARRRRKNKLPRGPELRGGFFLLTPKTFFFTPNRVNRRFFLWPLRGGYCKWVCDGLRKNRSHPPGKKTKRSKEKPLPQTWARFPIREK